MQWIQEIKSHKVHAPIVAYSRVYFGDMCKRSWAVGIGGWGNFKMFIGICKYMYRVGLIGLAGRRISFVDEDEETPRQRFYR